MNAFKEKTAMQEDQKAVDQQQVEPHADNTQELSQEELAGVSGGEPGPGRATFSEFQITKSSDNSTP